jgi:hypothetical protein
VGKTRWNPEKAKEMGPTSSSNFSAYNFSLTSQAEGQKKPVRPYKTGSSQAEGTTNPWIKMANKLMIKVGKRAILTAAEGSVGLRP